MTNWLYLADLGRLRHADTKIEDRFLHSVDTSIRVARLFLVILFRVRMASDLMSQHLRVILGLTEALCAVPPVAQFCGAKDVGMTKQNKNSSSVRLIQISNGAQHQPK